LVFYTIYSSGIIDNQNIFEKMIKISNFDANLFLPYSIQHLLTGNIT